jgi:AraC-like DNA-binding protein
LFLEQTVVPPSAELTIGAPGWRFVLVQQGQGYLFARPETRSLSPGEVLVLSPRAEAVFRASQIGEMTLAHFHVLPDLLTGLLTLAERRQLETKAGSSAPPLLHLPSDSTLAQHFVATCATKAPTNSLVRRCQLLELAGAIFAEELRTRGPRSQRIASARDRFRDLIQQMTEAEFLDHRPEELAERCGCSQRHFSRLFRRHLGISIRSKQTQMRLLKARQLLADTNEKVMTVANSAGYRHLGLFNAMFKRQFGMTPSEWRAQQRTALTRAKLSSAISSATRSA